jgi:Domain of unknown function (DUF4646)
VLTYGCAKEILLDSNRTLNLHTKQSAVALLRSFSTLSHTANSDSAMIIDVPESLSPVDPAVQFGAQQFHSFYASPPGSAPPAYEAHEQLNNFGCEKGHVQAPYNLTLSSLDETSSRSSINPSNAGPSIHDAHSTPPSFSRTPPSHCSYPLFSPTYLISTGRGLGEGFPILPPPSDMQPHPFVSHDVNEGDWVRYVSCKIISFFVLESEIHTIDSWTI